MSIAENRPVTSLGGNKLILLKWAAAARLPASVQDLLGRGDIRHVTVWANQGVWRIGLVLPGLIAPSHLANLGEVACQQVAQLNRIEWDVEYNLEMTQLGQICQDNWAELSAAIVEELPIFRGWLELAQPVIEDSTLTLFLENQLGVFYLNQKNGCQLLSGWFARRLGLEIQVILHSLVKEACSEFRCDEETAEALFQAARAAAMPEAPKKDEPPQPVTYGKAINTAPVPIKQIVEEEKSVTLQGRVLNLECRQLKSGRTLITFEVTDNTDSIAVKIFLAEGKDKGPGPDQWLKEGLWVIIRGMAQFDRYSQELTVMASDLAVGQAPVRQDPAEAKRVELHLHTRMSSMDALAGADEIVKRAALWGHEAVAITDHGVVQAFPEAYEAGVKHKVKVIMGLEGYLIDNPDKRGKGERRSYHIIILAKNQAGLKNLYQLVTGSHLEYYYRTPRIPRVELNRLREGLIIGSACEAGELIQAYLAGQPPEKLEEIASYYDYLEIQPTGNNEFLVRNGRFSSMHDLEALNQAIVDLGRRTGKPVVATGDVHFLDPADEIYRRILQAGKGFDDAEFQAPLYYKTTDEMLQEFAYLGPETAYEVVVKNTQMINSWIDKVKPIPDDLYSPKIPGAEEQISDMSYSRARAIYGDTLPPIVQARLEKELNSIINNGFAVLYLIAHKLVKKSNDDGYLVGSRGSVGSSLVATMTGITEVNPLCPHYICPNCHYSEFITDGSVGCGVDLPDKNCPQCGSPLRRDGHDIPFETFLGFDGDKVPDIDLNFSGDYQPRAHKYVEELFGKDYVFRAGTIATIAERTAFGFVKNYMKDNQIVARNAEINRLVKGCTGVKRTTGQHPGGLMVVPQDIDVHDFTPLQRPADDTESEVITTHFDYHSISSRLVKLDILGHDDPTVIRMLEDLTDFDPKQVPLSEPRVMQLFSGLGPLGVTPEQIRSNIGTYGIPEFGTRFVRQMLEDTQPKMFADLVRISGFSHGTDVWLNNAQEVIKSGKATVSEAIATRDDIMTYLIYQGMKPIVAFKIMEDVRKGKGLKPDYITAMKEQSIPDWYIESCQKIKYMFPKAHAVAYVTMAWRIAYFKVYFPEAFYASFYTVRADEFDAQLIVQGYDAVLKMIEEIDKKGQEASPKEKNLMIILEVALEMYARGIKLLPVDLVKSQATKFVITPSGLLPPLAALQGVGDTAARNIVQAREERPFTSVEDMRIRAHASKTVIDALAAHGCLNNLSATDQLELFA